MAECKDEEGRKPRPVGTNNPDLVLYSGAGYIEWLRNRVEDLENETPEEAEERRQGHADYTRERLRLDCMEFVNGEEDE